jgi:hypothetical protein
MGQPRVHPALSEQRASRQLLGRLLSQLELPNEEGETMLTPAQARAQKAGRARWDRAANLAELRKERARGTPAEHDPAAGYRRGTRRAAPVRPGRVDRP